MRQARVFLVVSDDPERLRLVSTNLQRKFPNAVVQTCRDSEAATQATRTQKLDAIVACGGTDMDALPLVEALRRETVAPIVLLSGGHHEKLASVAGASCFLDRDRWLIVGTVVADLLGARPESESLLEP
jgi:DNA-binding response OmpR family regulator